MQKHTADSIRWSSPTQLLTARSEACQWQSGRDAEACSDTVLRCPSIIRPLTGQNGMRVDADASYTLAIILDVKGDE